MSATNLFQEDPDGPCQPDFANQLISELHQEGQISRVEADVYSILVNQNEQNEEGV